MTSHNITLFYSKFHIDLLEMFTHDRTNVSLYAYEQMSHYTCMNRCLTIRVWTDVSLYAIEQMSHYMRMNRCLTICDRTDVSLYAYEQMSHYMCMNKYLTICVWTNISLYVYEQISHYMCMNKYLTICVWTDSSLYAYEQMSHYMRMNRCLTIRVWTNISLYALSAYEFWLSLHQDRFLTQKTHVQITFIFIGQTRLVFGKCVCTCVTKHSNAFRTFLNWLKNSKRVWHEPKLHISRLPLFGNFDLWSVSVWWV